MATAEIRIDRSKALVDDPRTGHNRWHPDIPPAVRVAPGDTVVIETRDAFDGQIGPDAGPAEVAAANLDLVHPLTGPVHVGGAERGDLLAVEIVEVAPESHGFTVQVPGFGFLRDDFPDPYIAHWEIADGACVSEQLPGVRIPGAPFIGTIGLAPDAELLDRTNARERELAGRGGVVLLPATAGAVPSDPEIAAVALRTIPPRETAGNVDIKQMTAGSTLLVPVYAEGALFSAGDAHFAQGDGEICGTAVEMSATLTARFDLRKGVAAERGITDTQLELPDWFHPTHDLAGPRRAFVTTGMPIDADGRNASEDATLAARQAMRNMIAHLGAEYGFDRQQAYAICSVAVDLRISQLVDVPNFIVSAFLPLDIFT